MASALVALISHGLVKGEAPFFATLRVSDDRLLCSLQHLDNAFCTLLVVMDEWPDPHRNAQLVLHRHSISAIRIRSPTSKPSRGESVTVTILCSSLL